MFFFVLLLLDLSLVLFSIRHKLSPMFYVVCPFLLQHRDVFSLNTCYRTFYFWTFIFYITIYYSITIFYLFFILDKTLYSSLVFVLLAIPFTCIPNFSQHSHLIYIFLEYSFSCMYSLVALNILFSSVFFFKYFIYLYLWAIIYRVLPITTRNELNAL